MKWEIKGGGQGTAARGDPSGSGRDPEGGGQETNKNEVRQELRRQARRPQTADRRGAGSGVGNTALLNELSPGAVPRGGTLRPRCPRRTGARGPDALNAPPAPPSTRSCPSSFFRGGEKNPHIWSQPWVPALAPPCQRGQGWSGGPALRDSGPFPLEPWNSLGG